MYMYSTTVLTLPSPSPDEKKIYNFKKVGTIEVAKDGIVEGLRVVPLLGEAPWRPLSSCVYFDDGDWGCWEIKLKSFPLCPNFILAKAWLEEK